MKFVKPCPRIPGTHPADTGKLCKALSPDSRHTSCGKPCPRIPGTHPADTGKLCKALSPDSRHTSCGHRQILQSPVPGFPAHILRTPANSAKPCPRVGRGIPPGNCKALSPGHGKAGRHDYGYSLQKKNGGKTAVPDTLCSFNNLWRFQARGQFPFL